MNGLEKTTQDWVEKESWLGPQHQPQVELLLIMARKIDEEATAQLANAYGVTLRNLMKQKPGTEEDDPLEAFLEGKED